MKLLPWIVVPMISARVVRAQEQLPIQEVGEVDTPKHSVEELAPAIGVHFTTSYAVAAARYANGTTRDIVRVAGDADYTDLMLQWASWRERWDRGERTCDPMCDFPHPLKKQSLEDQYKCKLQAIERRARSLLNLPRSRNAVVFTVFMTKVREAIEKELGATIADVAFAYPQLDTFDWRDFADGLQRSGLKPSTAFSQYGIPTFSYQEVNAAHAGLRHAACHDNDKHRADCVAGKSLFLNFDSACLSVALIFSESVFPRALLGYTGFHTKLGWWNLPVDAEPRAAFWVEVQKTVAHLMFGQYVPPSRIVLLGDHGADEEFLDVVKAAVWDEHQSDVSSLLNGTKKGDVGWLAARGVAELAWHDRNKIL